MLSVFNLPTKPMASRAANSIDPDLEDKIVISVFSALEILFISKM